MENDNKAESAQAKDCDIEAFNICNHLISSFGKWIDTQTEYTLDTATSIASSLSASIMLPAVIYEVVSEEDEQKREELLSGMYSTFFDKFTASLFEVIDMYIDSLKAKEEGD